MFSAVVAMDPKRGIGRKGQLPWKLAGDMRFFRELTTCPDRAAVEQRYGFRPETPADQGLPWETFFARIKSQPALPLPSPHARNAVLMGRRTWESLPDAVKPLPNRINGVLSRQGKDANMGTHRVWGDFTTALESLHRDESVREIFIIGGAQIYAEALRLQACTRLYVTAVETVFPCDVYFPEIPPTFRLAAASTPIEENGARYRLQVWERIPA